MNDKSIDILVTNIGEEVRNFYDDWKGLELGPSRLDAYLRSLRRRLVELGLKDKDAEFLAPALRDDIKYYVDEYLKNSSISPRTLSKFFYELEKQLKTNLFKNFEIYLLGIQYDLVESVIDSLNSRNGKYHPSK